LRDNCKPALFQAGLRCNECQDVRGKQKNKEPMNSKRIARFAAPLRITEKAKTRNGLLHIVLDEYPSGALRVALHAAVAEKGARGKASAVPTIRISRAAADTEQLGRGEFVYAGDDAELEQDLLKSGLFRATARKLDGSKIWRLDGLAIIELNSAYAPPLAATRVSFPNHLFHPKDFDAQAKKTLIESFESEGFSRHSATGASVWLIREYCESHKIPFCILLVKRDGVVNGVRICRKAMANSIIEREIAQGNKVELVYDSPLAR
jgi:hypothetical protein